MERDCCWIRRRKGRVEVIIFIYRDVVVLYTDRRMGLTGGNFDTRRDITEILRPHLQFFFFQSYTQTDNNQQDDTPTRLPETTTKSKPYVFKAQILRYHNITTSHPPVHHSQSSLDLSQAATVRQSNPIPTIRVYAQYLTTDE